MLQKKGFTLVELLVVIVILGIITGISIPLIRNLQQNNEMKKYTTYMDSIKQSAKLYTNSYHEDMFGHNISGCTTISYKQLEEKGLLKDIMINDVSCNDEQTYVKVIKMENKYIYTVSLACGKRKNDGTIDVDITLPENEISGIEACKTSNNANVFFTSTPEYPSEAINYQKRNIEVKLNSHTGFHEDIDISYGFIKSENKPSNDIDAPAIIGGWKKLEVNYIGGNEQKGKIENGNIITLSSSKVTTPSNETGDYYIVLKIKNLKDLFGREWNDDTHKYDYVYLGTYRIDNTKPVFAEGSKIESSVSGYNHMKPKLRINVTDNYSNASNLRMCTSYNDDTCSKKIKNIKEKTNGWISYDGSKNLETEIKPTLDGSTHTVYVTVADAAGNYTTKSYSYRLAATITYDKNGGSGTMNPTYCNIGETCTLATNTYTRTNFDFLGWYNAASGGTKYDATTTITGNTTVYAHWKARNHEITYTSSTACASASNCTNVINCIEGCTVTINGGNSTTISAPIDRNWLVEFYASGTLSVPNSLAVDIHTVGGGGGGAGAGKSYRAGGGGGGYTKYVLNKTLSAGNYNIVVGTGGAGGAVDRNGSNGGTSSFGSIVSAGGGNGGKTGDPDNDGYGNGGAGGSGGGGSGLCAGYDCLNAGVGGSDGAAGQPTKGTTPTYGYVNFQNEGPGQGTTTKDFGNGTLRAGGGGGRNGSDTASSSRGAGGAGGGGRGAYYDAPSNSACSTNNMPSPGDDHYGGGGGGGAGRDSCSTGGRGGSGIVILRNKR